ncbi:unnamed protein product [Ostreobium quekettii]|uniref:Ankyrin repeat n=1 Tax=Ostreobium quekettii TaxID=121088 RepID=A0A8S1IP76_9CHLO|nr:unnamed protein product [Ostreobium quekettii]|eukprot:evm.model.scf_1797.2 EVM.evm.TU.scf_1797.2   scf_1797:10082-11107(-)
MNAAPFPLGRRPIARTASCGRPIPLPRVFDAQPRAIRSVLQADASRPTHSGGRSRPIVRAEGDGAGGVDPRMADMQKQIEEMQKDPRMAGQMKAMQDAMKNPSVQKQMQQTVEYMQSDEMKKKMAAIQEDEELKPMFEELKTGGMGAMMKYMRDEGMMRKLAQKMGPPPEFLAGARAPQDGAPAPAAAPAAAAAAAPPVAPEVEINNLVDAAKAADLEAVEDFLAIGKDPNMTDEQERTPLHFAVATENMDVMDALMGAGAKLEVVDSMKNTPLHYAAGYGRKVAVRRLLDAGASGAVKNGNGKTPADLARLSAENPVGKDGSLMGILDEAAAGAPAFQDQ